MTTASCHPVTLTCPRFCSGGHRPHGEETREVEPGTESTGLEGSGEAGRRPSDGKIPKASKEDDLGLVLSGIWSLEENGTVLGGETACS